MNAIADTMPNQVILDGDIDTKTVAKFYPANMTIRQVMEEMHLSADRRETFNPDEPGVCQRSKYKDSGLWTRFGNEDGSKSIRIRVDVGCFCEHDCCGCMCGLIHSIRKVDGYVLVISKMNFNY